MSASTTKTTTSTWPGTRFFESISAGLTGAKMPQGFDPLIAMQHEMLRFGAERLYAAADYLQKLDEAESLDERMKVHGSFMASLPSVYLSESFEIGRLATQEMLSVASAADPSQPAAGSSKSEGAVQPTPIP